MMLRYDVIVVGDYCFDIIFTGLDEFPALGREVVAKGFEMAPGGSYNTAVALHRLGVKVGWAGDFGTDELSQKVLQWAKNEGLDDRLFVHHPIPLRRVTVAASYTEDRAFIAFYDPDPPAPAGLKALTRASARYLFVPGIYYGSAFEAGMMLLRAKKMKLVMDGNSYPDATLGNPKVEKAIRSVDIFLPNAEEARRVTGEDKLEDAIKRLGKLARVVVVKDGKNGAYGYSQERLVHVPGLEIHPLDTTGAGDCFNAGFLKAWLEGKPLEDCLRWGNVVGGLSTLGYGGTGRKIRVADVEAMIHKN